MADGGARNSTRAIVDATVAVVHHVEPAGSVHYQRARPTGNIHADRLPVRSRRAVCGPQGAVQFAVVIVRYASLTPVQCQGAEATPGSQNHTSRRASSERRLSR